MRALQAFTLLELILALALSVLILMAVGMAVDLHLRSFDSGRDRVEQSQLARSILRVISNDIRSVVVRSEQDVSGFEQLLKSSKQGGGRGGQNGGSQEGAGGEPSEGSEGSESEGILDGADGDDLALDEQTELSESTQDLVGSASLSAVAGIYGNQYELQIDVSRLPRMDQYQAIYPANDPSGLPDVTSDIKTVTYYVQSGMTIGAASGGGQRGELSELTDPDVVPGLVRRELDRAVSQWAAANSGTTALMQAGEVLAPEVVGIEFQYFDGFQWRTEWDTGLEGALPSAIEVTLALQSSEQSEALGTNLFSPDATEVDELSEIRYYRLVVQLPAAEPFDIEAAEELEGMMP